MLLNSIWGWGKWGKEKKLAKGHMANEWQSWDSNHVRFQSVHISPRQRTTGLLPQPNHHWIPQSFHQLATSAILPLQTSTCFPTQALILAWVIRLTWVHKPSLSNGWNSLTPCFWRTEKGHGLGLIGLGESGYDAIKAIYRTTRILPFFSVSPWAWGRTKLCCADRSSCLLWYIHPFTF